MVLLCESELPDNDGMSHSSDSDHSRKGRVRLDRDCGAVSHRVFFLARVVVAKAAREALRRFGHRCRLFALRKIISSVCLLRAAAGSIQTLVVVVGSECRYRCAVVLRTGFHQLMQTTSLHFFRSAQT